MSCGGHGVNALKFHIALTEYLKDACVLVVLIY